MTGYFRLILVGFVLAVTGCDAPQPSADAEGKERVVITPECLNRITDVQWTLESMVVDGRAVSLRDDRPTVQFGLDGRVTGFGSVNRFFGLMQMEANGRVKWPGTLGSTRMAGPKPLMRQEETFIAAIQTVRQWSIEGIRLYGQDDKGLTKLVFGVLTP